LEWTSDRLLNFMFLTLLPFWLGFVIDLSNIRLLMQWFCFLFSISFLFYSMVESCNLWSHATRGNCCKSYMALCWR